MTPAGLTHYPRPPLTYHPRPPLTYCRRFVPDVCQGSRDVPGTAARSPRSAGRLGV